MKYALTSGIGKLLVMQALRKLIRFTTLERSVTDSKTRCVPAIAPHRTAMLDLLLEFINGTINDTTRIATEIENGIFSAKQRYSMNSAQKSDQCSFNFSMSSSFSIECSKAMEFKDDSALEIAKASKHIASGWKFTLRFNLVRFSIEHSAMFIKTTVGIAHFPIRSKHFKKIGGVKRI